jgi:type I restriction enzyme S subunit
MSSEWPILPLEERLDALIDYRGKTPEKTNSGIPLITAKIIKNGRIEKASEFISKDGYDAWMRRGIPQAGDVVMTTEAPLGEVAQLGKEKIALAQRVVTLRGRSDLLNSTYLLYLLQTEEMQDQLKARATGTTVLGIKQSELRKISLTLPPIDLQRSSASVLAAIDARIDLLRETNTTLEAIAQALFKSWFVDFDPVCAKQQGREPEGMDSATAALFPDSFEESELGLAPKGWRVGTLADVTSVKGGFAYKSKDFGEVGSPVIKIKNIVGDGTVDLLDAQFIADEIAGKTKKFALKDGDIAIAMTGATIGKTGVVVTAGDKVPYLNQRVAKFEPNLQGQDNSWLVFVAFQNNFISEQVVNMASGSAQPNISTSGIESVRLVIPSNHALLEVFNDIVSPLFSGWIANQKQAQTLATLRDTLLPRLISGQLRLPEASASLV